MVGYCVEKIALDLEKSESMCKTRAGADISAG